MTLREFIGNDPYTSNSTSNSISVHTNDVFKSRIQKVLGKLAPDSDHDNVDYSYNKGDEFRTNSYDVEIGNQRE